MLQIENLSVKLKKNQIIDNMSCTFDTGVHGLLGPNGAGKTTFMRSILGLYPQAKGTVLVDDSPISKVNVGYLPQKFGLFPNMTVRQALTYLGNMKKIPNNILQKDIEEHISKLSLEDKIDCKMSTLSGGMIRRVGIAQAFLGNPPIIILDEPTAGLDPEERLRFKNYIKANQNDRIIIISTHIVDDVEYLCDYVEIMKTGKLLTQENCDAIAKHAEGKVYGLTHSELEQLHTNYDLVREYEENGQKKLRILLYEEAKGTPLTPTLEDGYLCVSKTM